MKRGTLTFVLSLAFFLLTNCTPGLSAIGNTGLVEDVRQLVEFIDQVHPDPYLRGGGRVAFHRLFQDLLASIPESGMDREEFYLLIRPLVASVGDSHTWLRDPFRTDFFSPGGIPLYFGVIEASLYVRAVTDDEHRNLIGHRLTSIEGVAYEEIVARQNRVMGADNEYQLLRNLAGTGVLWQRPFLENILPEWRDKDRIAVGLKSPQGEIQVHTLGIPSKVKYPLISNGSKYQGPSMEKCDFVYSFIDDEKQIAILSITGMNSYREAFEMWKLMGQDIREDAKEVYERYHGSDPPEDLDMLIMGLPSATEVFRDLVVEMKEAQTKNLIIDLRKNEGGNSAMYNILVYFLYGKAKLLDTKRNRYEIEKYSSPYFEANPLVTLSGINDTRKVKLEQSDYDFSGLESDDASISKEFEELTTQMPSFRNEIESGTYDAYYCPDNVYVVSSQNTFSSGYTLMYYLYRAGAELVGTPSSQSGNCFGDVLSFELRHSHLTGTVSHKKFVYFPDDEEKGRVLIPDYQLSYDKLASYDYDLNAEMLYAIEIATHGE